MVKPCQDTSPGSQLTGARTERMLPAHESLTHRLQHGLEAGAGAKAELNAQPQAWGGQLVKRKLQDPLRALGSKLFHFSKKHHEEQNWLFLLPLKEGIS